MYEINPSILHKGSFLWDFKIEVKYLKNWISSANTRAAGKNWSVFQQDFDWLMDEIDNGESPVITSSERKGKYRCMFIGEEEDKFHFAIYYGK